MDIFERHLFEFDLRVKLDKRNIFIHTYFLCLHIGQLHQNHSIIDQNHEIEEVKNSALAGKIDEYSRKRSV